MIVCALSYFQVGNFQHNLYAKNECQADFTNFSVL